MKSWRTTKKWVAAGSLALVFPALIAGCGNAGNAETGGGSTIKIGVVAARSGHGASLWGEASKVAEAWEQFVNDKGGINGREVEVIVRDGKSEPAAGLAVAQDLVKNEKVSAIMTLDTQAESSVAPYLQTAKIPLLGINFNPAVTELPNVYNVNSSVAGFSRGTVLAAQLEGKTTMGSLYCSEAPSCATAAGIYEKVGASLDVDFVGGLAVDATAPNYTAPCLTLMQKGVDYIEVDQSTAAQVRIAGDCVKQGFDGVFGVVGSTVDIESYSTVKGATFAGSINAFPWWVDEPPVVEYRDALAKYDSSIKYGASAPAAAWTTLQLFAKAMADADDTSPAGVTKALGSVKDETLDGLLASPVTLEPNAPTESPACFWLFKYTAGDENPTLLKGQKPGNGETGDLASSCIAE